MDLDNVLDRSAAMKKATEEGKCYAGAIAEIKLPNMRTLRAAPRCAPLSTISSTAATSEGNPRQVLPKNRPPPAARVAPAVGQKRPSSQRSNLPVPPTIR
jgi:hypothetical protein